MESELSLLTENILHTVATTASFFYSNKTRQKESGMGSISNSNENVRGCSSAFARSLPSDALKDPVFSDEIIRYHHSLLDSTERAQELGEGSLAPIMTSYMFAHNAVSDSSDSLPIRPVGKTQPDAITPDRAAFSRSSHFLQY